MADAAEIQIKAGEIWITIDCPVWSQESEYRIKQSWPDKLSYEMPLLCCVWDSEFHQCRKFVVRYVEDSEYPYIDESGTLWTHARPMTKSEI